MAEQKRGGARTRLGRSCSAECLEPHNTFLTVPAVVSALSTRRKAPSFVRRTKPPHAPVSAIQAAFASSTPRAD